MKININNDWALKYSPINTNIEDYQKIAEEDGWMKCSLPCDVHMPLLDLDIIPEPTLSDYAYQSEWIEDKAWWFKKEIHCTSEQLSFRQVELVLEKLDYHADIFVNGKHAGNHKNLHRPFVKDIKKHLLQGVNVLLVRLTVGLETVDMNDITPIWKNIATESNNNRGDRGDERRAMLRKPQYVFGWDWSPRCATCGITGEGWLAFHNDIAIRHILPATLELTEEETGQWDADIKITVNIENFNEISTYDGQTIVAIKDPAGNVICQKQYDSYILSGAQYFDFEFHLTDISPWWPAGMGQPDLYSVAVSIQYEHGVVSCSKAFGIRTTSLIHDKYDEQNRLFALKINGRRVFCKGGNWIPSDLIYARITHEKYASLINEAVNANFNMLRVWGGGFFEPDCFYDLCDQNGIMIWHDFMFGCAMVPDYLPWFNEEVRLEVDYQTKYYGSHPCIVLWCGNNENHTAFESWWEGDSAPSFFGGAYLYNNLIPDIVRKNTPFIPYWNSSPYGGKNAASYESGDVHAWGDGIMNPDMNVRIDPTNFDRIPAKFFSEYGYVGTCCKSTITKYMDGAEIDPSNPIWQLHNNTFEKQTVAAGIKKHYADPDKLDIDQYLLYAGLCQGLMLGYSLEAYRFKPEVSGGLFWMYNDCWGETGWTIIDYYLTRKISYYFVKRALTHQRLIIRQKDGIADIAMVNDTHLPVDVTCEYGYCSFDGKSKESFYADAHVEKFGRSTVISLDIRQYDLANGCIYASGKGLIPAILNSGEFRTLHYHPKPQIHVSSKLSPCGKDLEISLSADQYAHAVHFNLDDRIKLSDHYFDLLPGESRTITAYNIPAGLDARTLCAAAVNKEPDTK